MSDDSMIKIMQSLGIDYNPAINSTLQFQKTIGDLNKQLETMKAIAMQSAKDVNNAFSSQLRGGNSNQIVDQFGLPFKTMKAEAKEASKSVQDMAKSFKESSIEQMKAQAASVQQRVATKGLSEEYGLQAGKLREQLSVIQARLQTEGKLTAEEVKQTSELKEQLEILRAQTRTATADDIRENPSTLNQEFERRSSWFLTGAMFYGTINAAKETAQTIETVEMGMVELARVMDDTSFVFDDYRDNLFKLGVDYGQTFDNVQSIALRWAQSGYNVADSLELTKTSLLALNTAELDATNATESMIGIMAQWQLQAEDMAFVMDKINITADNYSITSQDLVDGLLRSSSAARNMNMSLDETIGLLTVMREASGRTGKEVGNALNSILSYVTRGKSIENLEGLGIQMFTDNTKTQFRNAMEIFQDIHSKWDSLSMDIQDGFVKSADDAGLFNEELANAVGIQEQWNDVQKRDASQSAAGTHRRNYFIGMIERMSNVQGVLNGMIDAEGYSMAENAKTMETLEKKQESLKISAEALAVAIGDAGLEGALKGLADGGTNALDAINSLPKPMKDLVLATTTTFVAVKALELGMKTFGIQLPGISQVIASLTSGTWSLTAALKAGGAGIATFAAANAPLLALSAAVGVIMSVTNAIKKQREEQEKAVAVFNQQQNIYSEVNNLIPVYESLAEATSLNAEKTEQLAEVKQKIIDLLPKSKEFIDNENLSLSEQVDIVKDLNEKELERLRIAASKVLSKGSSAYEKDKQDLDQLIEKQKELDKLITDLGKKNLAGTITQDELALWDEASKLMGKNGVKIDELTSKTNAYENAERFMTESLNDNSDAIKANSDWVGKLNMDYKVTQEVMDALTKSFEDATSKINVYQSILTELNSKEGLSAKSKQDIIAKHQELLPYLGNEVELRKRLIEIIAKEEQVQRQAYANMIMDNEAFFNSKIKGNSILVDKLGEFYTKDLENAKSLADAKLMVETKLIQTMAKQWAKFYQTSAIAGEGYVQVMGAGGMIDSTGSNMAQNMANELRKVSGLFNDVALSVGGVDLKGINLSDTKGSKGSKGSKSKEENKALEEALKLLEHKKKMSVENLDSLKAEVAELKRINSLYAKSNDEKMDMAEKIYAAEKRFMDRRLQDSVNWINDKKNMNELSADEEIAAWERVKNNQSDNIEAVKQATLNLYKLKEQVMLDAYNQEEKHIQHLTKLGTLNTEEQLKAYEKLYSFKAQSIDEEYSRIENLHALNKKIDEERETARKEWISKENGLYDDQQNRLQALASIQETIIQIIRKRGEEEKKALDVAHNAEMDSLEKRHNERKKKSQEDLDLYKKTMQAKIDEYDKQNTEEDYQEQLQKEKEKADEIQREIDMRSLDNSLVSKDKVVKLRKQLAEQVEKISKMQQTRERDLIKKSLQDSLKGYEDSTKEKEDIADKNYDNEKKRLEENYQISKEFLERKYSDEKIYSEARESIMRGTVEVAKGQFEDIYDAYQSFEDKFGKGMGVLGDIIKSDFTKQLEIAQQAIDQLDYKASNLRKKYDNDYQPSREDGYNDPYPDRPSSGGSSSGSSSGKLSSMSKTDYEVYINMKKLWEDSNKKGDQTYMDYANKRANEIRSKYGISSDNYSYDQLKNIPYDELKIAGYDTGGIIPRDGFIMAHEKELYLNSQHQNHLWNFINDLPQMRMPDFSYSMPPSPPSTLQPNITLKIENQIRIDGNVTSEALPEIKELVLDANQDLVNKLNKSGTFRPKY